MTEIDPRIGSLARRIAGLPLRMRRRVLRTTFTLSGLVRGFEKTGHARLFQRLLRQPSREARRLEREVVLHNVQTEAEWLALLVRSIPALKRDTRRIAVSDPAALERAAATGRPVILTPLHMGAYVLSLACLMIRFFPGRPLLVLRQRDDMPLETAVIERIREVGVEMRFHQVTDRMGFLEAVRFARNGAVIVNFCDLDPAYGAPAPMPVLGLETRFAFGTDTLARLTNALVVPLACTMEPEGDLVRVGPTFEVHSSAPEERARVAALVRAHIEASLRARPEQWHLWSALRDYLPVTDTVTDDASRTKEADEPIRTAA
ncbi:lysophospholipid acyltransferase family protein [Methylobacterium radiodurans]|uniref:Lipid A biosynthesis acyltransferase n=1 Tax=Methylobacterium radiodurans TaxID=2202828 RepID=A0A2U8VLF1_9HYPH|nr:lysophospholipid acyltransferase family protein [Methylobacterium radiodurans]AWN34444.1 hypothetical protein DK427_00685 [Methylobacterium radiodurans]